MPFFGIAAWASQSIFVDRGSKNSAEIVSRKIVERVGNDVQEHGLPRKFPTLLIFPEGTTVNQTALLPFKKGAFMAGKPVSMSSIRYSHKFYDHSDASQPMIKAHINALIGLYNTVQVEYYGDYIPNEDEAADPQLFASNVNKYYEQQLGWETIPCTYKDKYYFMGKNKDYETCSDYFKKTFG